jgi:hypothetical protein
MRLENPTRRASLLSQSWISRSFFVAATIERLRKTRRCRSMTQIDFIGADIHDCATRLSS